MGIDFLVQALGELTVDQRSELHADTRDDRGVELPYFATGASDLEIAHALVEAWELERLGIPLPASLEEAREWVTPPEYDDDDA
jgi:hypothetical protein